MHIGTQTHTRTHTHTRTRTRTHTSTHLSRSINATLSARVDAASVRALDSSTFRRDTSPSSSNLRARNLGTRGGRKGLRHGVARPRALCKGLRHGLAGPWALCKGLRHGWAGPWALSEGLWHGLIESQKKLNFPPVALAAHHLDHAGLLLLPSPTGLVIPEKPPSLQRGSEGLTLCWFRADSKLFSPFIHTTHAAHELFMLSQQLLPHSCTFTFKPPHELLQTKLSTPTCRLLLPPPPPPPAPLLLPALPCPVLLASRSSSSLTMSACLSASCTCVCVC